MTPYEFREAWLEDELELIETKADPSWRHGCYMYEVYKDAKGNYYSVSFRRSGDGEYHGLRDDEGFDMAQVYPHEIVVKKTIWKTEPQ